MSDCAFTSRTVDQESGRPRPLVTVIVPVWNAERYLRESLDSILSQTYSPIEVIVMDDASTDGSPEIVRSYGEAVRYHRQSSNRGQFGNVNDGILLARGEFVAVYHADDVYEPVIVEREVAFLQQHPDVGAVFTSMVLIDGSSREQGRLVLPPSIRGNRPLTFEVVLNTMLTYENRFLMCPSALVRRDVYAKVGLHEEEFRREATSDVAMWLRISRFYRIAVLEDRLFRYRFGHGSEGQRYHHLRTAPSRYFTIVDLHVKDSAPAVVSPNALRAHEAHRNEDRLMCAVNAYILGRLDESRRLLHTVHPARLLGSRVVQRGRLALIYAAMQILVCLPRIPAVARALFWRRHGGGRPRPGQQATFANA